MDSRLLDPNSDANLVLGKSKRRSYVVAKLELRCLLLFILSLFCVTSEVARFLVPIIFVGGSKAVVGSGSNSICTRFPSVQ